MLNSNKLKSEIDNIPKEYYGVIWNMFQTMKTNNTYAQYSEKVTNKKWLEFISATYGSLSDAPIERGEQEAYELREDLI